MKKIKIEIDLPEDSKEYYEDNEWYGHFKEAIICSIADFIGEKYERKFKIRRLK